MYARHGTLTATVVATVTPDADYRYLEVYNRSTVAQGYIVYFTVRGADPTVAGNDTYVVMPMTRCVLDDTKYDSPAVVKLISSAAAPYSVTAHDAAALTMNT